MTIFALEAIKSGLKIKFCAETPPEKSRLKAASLDRI
jgi:hypothetical protein